MPGETQIVPVTSNESYYRARYYDESVGRFINEDTQRFQGGFDFYPYVLNNPIGNIDPYGLEPADCKDCKGKPIQGLAVGKTCCADEPGMSSSSPDPYLPWEGYAGINAGMMFKHGGNGAWGQIVRGCLLCMYRHGATPNQAHWFCYFNADRRVTRGQAESGWAHGVGAAAGIGLGQAIDILTSRTVGGIQSWGPIYQLFGGSW
jgi:RHS repeat-associated protein